MKNFFFPINADHRREIEARGKNGDSDVFIGAGIIGQSVMRNSAAIKNVIKNYCTILDTIKRDFSIAPPKEKTSTVSLKRKKKQQKKENATVVAQRRVIQKSGEKYMTKKMRTKTTKSSKAPQKKTPLLKQWYDKWNRSGTAGYIDGVPTCFQAKFKSTEPPAPVSFAEFCKSDAGILLLHFNDFIKSQF